jgi:hypothetical protein
MFHYTTPRHITQHNTTKLNTKQHNTTQHNTTQNNTTQLKTTQHKTTKYNTTQYHTTPHNTTQHHTTLHHPTSTATIEKGSVLRLSLAEFYANVLWVVPPEVDEDAVNRFRRDGEDISGIPEHLQTDDDKFYIRVYRKARLVLTPTILGVLDNYHLIPRNARTAAYKYFHAGRPGKDITIQRKDERNLFVVITGCIRMELEAQPRLDADGKMVGVKTIHVMRKGESSMTMKVGKA